MTVYSRLKIFDSLGCCELNTCCPLSNTVERNKGVGWGGGLHHAPSTHPLEKFSDLGRHAAAEDAQALRSKQGVCAEPAEARPLSQCDTSPTLGWALGTSQACSGDARGEDPKGCAARAGGRPAMPPPPPPSKAPQGCKAPRLVRTERELPLAFRAAVPGTSQEERLRLRPNLSTPRLLGLAGITETQGPRAPGKSRLALLKHLLKQASLREGPRSQKAG